ncbi:lysine-2,3-aminomutase-like protein [Hyphomicrobium methylovorum]|uniref:lysine-2,3-aminomutase-like protein n=1 Tax=Hyphomicrobium methylovorum TaxID=84 RepID=UPI0015E6E19A|nr:lysine-2,3-aminomutase-like protein [Hyphomicrobium methylovorum]MBA2127678.1 lysine-2,3-aminomutase-like protein [Hyphomicrobium methylovorum]
MSRHAGKITTVGDLVARGLAAEAQRSDLEAVASRYAVALTPELAHLINPDDPTDPIARQFVPDIRELETHPAELGDPIGDRIKSPAPGVVHRYPDRVLLKIASVCPVYCRFCFRREMVGPENGEALSATDFKAALAYIGANPGIWEVILTGGDPFVLSPRRIREATEALSHIGHVKVLRWHTRVPVVDSGRITPEFISALKATQQTVFVGLHVNHPHELTPKARVAIASLVDAGLPMVSQTVLLRGVNDDANTLEALMRALVELRVKPYYLHHGDLAPGTAHFRTTVEQGQDLMRELRRRLSGLALPTYVLDIPGAHGKVPLERYVTPTGDGKYAVTDSRGDIHDYDDCCAAPDTP